jgi:diamine N-acetyltransferase
MKTDPPRPDAFLLRDASPADAAALSAFAALVFEETFGPGSRREDIDAYLAEAFSPIKQQEEVRDPQSAVVLALRSNAAGEALAGYAHVKFGDADASALLKRLYVDSAWQGSGLARRLLDDVVKRSNSVGCRRLWLTVWDQNHRAIAFYKKSGFSVAGVTHFQLGADLQTDLLMEMRLPL